MTWTLPEIPEQKATPLVRQPVEIVRARHERTQQLGEEIALLKGLNARHGSTFEQKGAKATKRENRARSGGQTPKCPFHSHAQRIQEDLCNFIVLSADYREGYVR